MGLTIQAFDGFDWCASGYMNAIRGDLWINSGAIAAGRFGGQALTVYNNSNGVSTAPLGITDQQAVYFAWYIPAGNGGSLLFKDTSNGTQFTLYVDQTTRRMSLVRGSTTVAIGTHPYVGGVWYSVQVHFFLHDTNGRCVVKVEGVTDLDFTGDTKNTAVTNISYVTFSGGPSVLIDDVAFYQPDTIGVDWMQDSKVTTKNPNGAGATTDWAVTGAADNHTAQASTDGDTSYVASSTPGQIDTYAMSAASPLGLVYAVNVGLIARKDDVATRQIRHALRIAASNYTGPTKTLASGYVNYTDMLAADPATAVPWTLAGVDAVEAGLEEVA